LKGACHQAIAKVNFDAFFSSADNYQTNYN